MHRSRHGLLGIGLVLMTLSTSISLAQDRATKVRSDRQKVESDGYWIYNDLTRGVEKARTEGKPLLVVFRCIPCEACAQLDEQIVERDASVQELLAKFVCVRIVHANGLDLNQFQYDYDQSWAAFFLNADMTIYGRYGTRSHETDSEDDVSLSGFSKALAGALELHREYPQNKALLAAKRGPASAFRVPEAMPGLAGKYSAKLDYEGKVIQSCIHCHQVGEALRIAARTGKQPISDNALYPYPNPKILGFILDPKERVQVREITGGSSAERDEFQVGDEIVSLAGQPLLSIADMQWVLHNAPDSGSLVAEIERNGQRITGKLTLATDWRRHDDISWRATSWDLRRMVTGGMRLNEVPRAEREKAGVKSDGLALAVKHVGEFGAHAVAKKAGFQKGDIIVSVDGLSNRMSESDLLAHLFRTKKTGERVIWKILRGNKPLELSLAVQ